MALSAFFYGAWVLIKALFVGDPVPGYPSLMVVVMFLGGTQLMAIGIIGEYLARVFVEVKQRPLYLVADVHSQGSTPPVVAVTTAPLRSFPLAPAPPSPSTSPR